MFFPNPVHEKHIGDCICTGLSCNSNLGVQQGFRIRENPTHHFQEHYDNPELGTTMQASGNDKHACRVCLKFFTRNSDVKAHILRVHCGDRRYPCTMCGKRFKESTHLRKHLYTHTGKFKDFCINSIKYPKEK